MFSYIQNAFSTTGHTFLSFYTEIPTKAVLLAVALLLCFFGCKLTRWVSALYGVCLGIAGATALIAIIELDMPPMAALAVMLGIIAAICLAIGLLFFRFPRLCIFLIWGCIGFAIGYVPAAFAGEYRQEAYWAILAACSLLFAVTGVLYETLAFQIITSVSGVPAGIVLADLLELPEKWMGLLIGLGFTIVGFVVQRLLDHRRANRHTAEDYRDKQGEEPLLSNEKSPSVDEDLQYTQPHLHVVTPVSEEEKDDIDRISDSVAEALSITGSIQPATPQSMDRANPMEQADDRTMLLKAEATEIIENTEVMETTEAIGTTEAMGATEAIEVVETEIVGTAPLETLTEKMEDMTAAVSPETDASTTAMKTEVIPSDTTDSTEAVDDTAAVTTERSPIDDTVITEILASAKIEKKDAVRRQDTASEDFQTELMESAFSNHNLAAEDDDTGRPLPVEELPFPKERKSIRLMSLILAAAALVFAAIGIQYVEIMLALCFVGYMLKYYRTTAFACMVLCVRRIVDIVLLVLQKNSYFKIGMNGVSCVIFFVLALASLQAYIELKHADDSEKE